MSKDPLNQWVQFHRKLFGMMTSHAVGHGGAAWNPNADVYEGPDGLVVKLELAGMAAGSVRVQVEGLELVVEGHRRDPYSSETAAGYRFRQMEIQYGYFRRAITLPFPVDARRARARSEAGLLSIELPRARSQRRATLVVVEV
jgi:HSP20 family protein